MAIAGKDEYEGFEGILDCVDDISNNGGVRAFYRGIEHDIFVALLETGMMLGFLALDVLGDRLAHRRQPLNVPASLL